MCCDGVLPMAIMGFQRQSSDDARPWWKAPNRQGNASQTLSRNNSIDSTNGKAENADPPGLAAIAKRVASQLKRDPLDVGDRAPDANAWSILENVNNKDASTLLSLTSQSVRAKRAIGSLVGMAVADATGAPLEFLPVEKKGSRFDPKSLKVTGAYNKFCLKPGQWTDDTSMGLCLADSLLVCGSYNGMDIRVRFWSWWNRGYNNAFRRDHSRSKSVGLGGNIRASLSSITDNKPPPRYIVEDGEDAGNGSVMRLAPVPIFFHNDIELAERASAESSYTTHPGPVAAEACAFLGFVIVRAITRDASSLETAAQFLDSCASDYMVLPQTGETLIKFLKASEPKGSPERCWNWRDPAGPYLEETLRNRGKTYNGYPVSSGYFGSYCMDGMAIAFHSIYHTVSFVSAIARCVNFLGDADSTGAICGQIAGAFYGIDAIDKRFIKRLNQWDDGETALRGALLYALGTDLSDESKKRTRSALAMSVDAPKVSADKRPSDTLKKIEEDVELDAVGSSVDGKKKMSGRSDSTTAPSNASSGDRAPPLSRKRNPGVVKKIEPSQKSMSAPSTPSGKTHGKKGSTMASVPEVERPERAIPTLSSITSRLKASRAKRRNMERQLSAPGSVDPSLRRLSSTPSPSVSDAESTKRENTAPVGRPVGKSLSDLLQKAAIDSRESTFEIESSSMQPCQENAVDSDGLPVVVTPRFTAEAAAPNSNSHQGNTSKSPLHLEMARTAMVLDEGSCGIAHGTPHCSPREQLPTSTTLSSLSATSTLPASTTLSSLSATSALPASTARSSLSATSAQATSTTHSSLSATSALSESTGSIIIDLGHWHPERWRTPSIISLGEMPDESLNFPIGVAPRSLSRSSEPPDCAPPLPPPSSSTPSLLRTSQDDFDSPPGKCPAFIVEI